MVQHIKFLLKEELEFGSLRLLMPVFFGVGIILYFISPDEPNLWGTLALSVVFIIVLCVKKGLKYKLTFSVLALISSGFTIACLRATLSSHPVLREPTSTIDMTARIEKIERREANDRITLFVHEMPGEKLRRVRVISRQRITFRVGDDVSVKVRLLPPSEPSRPGGYDFARDSWFNGLAAVGYSLGEFQKAMPRSWTLAAYFQITIERMREAISNRIRYALKGEAGAMADALVTGRRDGLTMATQDALRSAGTYHILSISGFHMTLVAAFIFTIVRGIFALMPSIAQRFNVKVVAGTVAFTIAGFYNLLAGSEVATVRSWLMITLVLLGVILSRSSFTLHTLSVSAMIILIFAPETLLSPSFQMSFAATLVLVAGYKGAHSLLDKYANENSWLQKIGITLTSGITGLAFASFFAGLSTLPFTAYHFHQVQAYGVIGNLIGGPIIEYFVMPLEVIALLLWGFGFDLWIWPIIGWAIELFLASAHWIATFPKNMVIIPVFSSFSLALGGLGFILLFVMKTKLRLIGLWLMLIASLTAFTLPKPFLLADSTNTTIAVINKGELHSLSEKPIAYVLNEWRQAYKLERGKPHELCDAYGCLIQTDNISIFRTKTMLNLVEDCALNAIIITKYKPPKGCSALIIHEGERTGVGGMAIYKTEQGFRVETAADIKGNRLWQQKIKRIIPTNSNEETEVD